MIGKEHSVKCTHLCSTTKLIICLNRDILCSNRDNLCGFYRVLLSYPEPLLYRGSVVTSSRPADVNTVQEHGVSCVLSRRLRYVLVQ